MSAKPPPDDRTVLLRPPGNPPAPVALPVEITYPLPGGGQQTERFTSTFRIGRDQDCTVRLSDEGVSRQHLEVYLQEGHWWVRDLQSSNGTYQNDQLIQQLPLVGTTTLELSKGGPVIYLTVPQPQDTAAAQQPLSREEIHRRYFDSSYTGPAGEHTLLVRRTFQQLKRKQSRRYWGMIGVIIILLLGAGSVAVYQHLQLQKARELAVDIFYNMKTLELQIDNLEARIDDLARAASQADLATRKQQLAERAELQQQIVKLQQQRTELLTRYEEFASKARPILVGTGDAEQIILQVARLFGECEINMPDGFADKVKGYINKWKATSRLPNAIQRLKENHYAPVIYRAMTGNQLPPQFLYLALQESSFHLQAVGPRTRYGIAKGMWQFIPDTALRYNLHPGPLRELEEYDPEDERYHFEKATEAAAKYIRDIYRTDAQASGLLVMASYNWGEGNVIRLIRKMPENPKERNFWQLLQHYQIPQETYDYVFYIFSAAVIGENPRLFGFNFDNPLAEMPDPARAAGAGTTNSDLVTGK
jgi:hypothetical protein